MTWTAIIFDAEGVVIDTTGIWDAAQAEFLARRGHGYDRSTIKPLLTGRDIRSSTSVLVDLYSLPGRMDDLVIERRELTRTLFTSNVDYIPGALEFIGKAKARFLIAMATALDPELFDLADATLRLRTLFDGRVSTMRDVMGVGKPDPAVFLHAGRGLDCAPENCIVIEDAPLGIAAARAAGMASVAITTTYPRETFKNADHVFSNFAEIASWLGV